MGQVRHASSPSLDQEPGLHWALHWPWCVAPVSTAVNVPLGQTRHVSWNNVVFLHYLFFSNNTHLGLLRLIASSWAWNAFLADNVKKCPDRAIDWNLSVLTSFQFASRKYLPQALFRGTAPVGQTKLMSENVSFSTRRRSLPITKSIKIELSLLNITHTCYCKIIFPLPSSPEEEELNILSCMITISFSNCFCSNRPSITFLYFPANCL